MENGMEKRAPLASVQQQELEDAVVRGAPCEQQQPLEAVRLMAIFNTTAITPKRHDC
jgi:hypothetical protein